MIEIKQRKVCGACKACDFSSKSCDLGYETKIVYLGGSVYNTPIDMEPLNPCPKPLSTKQLVECYSKYRN